MQGPHAASYRRVVLAAARADDEMALEASQLATGRDQPIAKIGVTIEEFGTIHGTAK
jgi:hypothetical protein